MPIDIREFIQNSAAKELTKKQRKKTKQPRKRLGIVTDPYGMWTVKDEITNARNLARECIGKYNPASRFYAFEVESYRGRVRKHEVSWEVFLYFLDVEIKRPFVQLFSWIYRIVASSKYLPSAENGRVYYGSVSNEWKEERETS